MWTNKIYEKYVIIQYTYKKDRNLTYGYGKVLNIIADVSESSTEYPIKSSKQKAKYSGKKKRHRNKTEIVIDKASKKNQFCF